MNDKTPDSKIDRIERKQISQNRFIKIFNEVNEESMLRRWKIILRIKWRKIEIDEYTIYIKKISYKLISLNFWNFNDLILA